MKKRKTTRNLHIFRKILVISSETPGLLREEMETSIDTLKNIQKKLDFEIELLREKSFSNNTRFIDEYLVRKHIDQEDFMEVR